MEGLSAVDFLIVLVISSVGIFCISDLLTVAYFSLSKEKSSKSMYFRHSYILGIAVAVFLFANVFNWSGCNFGKRDCVICIDGVSDCPVCIDGRTQLGSCTLCNGTGSLTCTYCNGTGKMDRP